MVGRSILVGKPLASLLLQANATVTQCHSRTRDLAEVCRGADVLVAAVGSPGMITADMVRQGAVVIDVGTNRADSGLVGDVDFEAVREKARAIHAGTRRRRTHDAGDAARQHPEGRSTAARGRESISGHRLTGVDYAGGRWTCEGFAPES